MYGTCNRCGIGHIPSQCPEHDPSTIRTRPFANFANTRAQSSNASANWHSDTRVNSHVTPDLEAMDNSEAYYGGDALHVGNAKGNKRGTIDNIISQLGSVFALKDLGPLYFLGIEIVPHVSGILVSQNKYILELLQSDGLFNCNHVSSFMVTSSSLSLDDSTAFSNPVKYRQVVGSLQYVTISRPDIAFAVNKVLLRPRIIGLQLNGFYGIFMIRRFRRSTIHGGFAIYLGSNLISWTARKQHTVSRFSTEAEYKALANIVVELTLLQALLHEFGIRSSSTPILWCDNLVQRTCQLTLSFVRVQNT
uniref:Uncharacterized protein n=1 Tax=Tanacetum cinerariifolium TaxID=118510 RepID=A0A6L2JXJ4_TANCI|nr:hypothetical protein [Tanacetum cinerariifolium]